MSNRLIQEFFSQSENKEVYFFQGPYSPLLIQIPWLKGLDLPIIGVNKGRESLFAVNEFKYRLCSEEKFRSYLEKKVSLGKLTADFNSFMARSQALYDEALEIDLHNAEESTLIALLKKIELLFEMISTTIYIEQFDDEIANKVLSTEAKSKLKTIWEKATNPVFVSFETRRQKFLLDTIHGVSDMSAVVREVKYVYTDYFSTKTESEILSILTLLKSNEVHHRNELEHTLNNTEKKLQEYIAWRNLLTLQEKFLADYIQVVMHFRDLRKDPIAQAQAVLFEITNELLDRADIDQKYCTVLNIYECLKGVTYLKSLKNEILERINGNISIHYADTKVAKFENCDFQATKNEFLVHISKKNINSRVLKGQIANKGKVTGTVRIVLDPLDEKGFQNGDILVTSMTRPEFVPLMKRAGAVVTNEGGITCHAAIVSRELNIPCIIGTKNATQIIKDGDFIEVDAEKGIVTILGEQ